MAWAPLVLSCVVLLLTAVGIRAGGLRTRTFRMFIRLNDETAAERAPVVLCGNRIEATGDLDFRIKLRNVAVLAAVSVLSIFVLIAYGLSRIQYTATLTANEERYLLLNGLTYLGIVPILVAGIWAKESVLLRVADTCIGTVHRRGRHPVLGAWTSYGFRDPRGGYFGGTSHNYDHARTDNVVIIFFAPSAPGFNAASCSMMFHRVEMTSDMHATASSSSPA